MSQPEKQDAENLPTEYEVTVIVAAKGASLKINFTLPRATIMAADYPEAIRKTAELLEKSVEW